MTWRCRNRPDRARAMRPLAAPAGLPRNRGMVFDVRFPGVPHYVDCVSDAMRLRLAVAVRRRAHLTFGEFRPIMSELPLFGLSRCGHEGKKHVTGVEGGIEGRRRSVQRPASMLIARMIEARRHEGLEAMPRCVREALAAGLAEAAT